LNVRDARPDELVDWDARTVVAPGGHVYQSRAWAEHRRRSGWTPRFLVADDGGRVLALSRGWPLIGGGSAYIPRGPVADVSADRAAAGVAGSKDLAARQVAVADALASDGIDVVAADPEVPAGDDAYRAAIETAGFRPIEEIQPSRHRVSLPLEGGADEPNVFEGIAKSTRQRIHRAERDGLVVVRHDVRTGPDGVGEGFADPKEPAPVALDHFYDLLLETGERRQFSFGPRSSFVGWWRSAFDAGHLIYLEAWPASGSAPQGAEPPPSSPTRSRANEPLAGLVLYRHGGRLSTVHSGDHATTRAEYPGALHLLRWRAIQLAIREGCTEMDLGGVDVRGARDEPREGDALFGLYQHKRSFGGHWIALTGAHERVFDPRGYAVGRLTGRLGRLFQR
jgi:lipid II:glycine glycyltransferase (peptidoglycan interpeptide bridge formation enzyme)